MIVAMSLASAILPASVAAAARCRSAVDGRSGRGDRRGLDGLHPIHAIKIDAAQPHDAVHADLRAAGAKLGRHGVEQRAAVERAVEGDVQPVLVAVTRVDEQQGGLVVGL